eukprot:11403612-Ditylum_brightwellii.AAC.1
MPSDKRPIGKSDLDTHADTCVAGATHKVLERTAGQFCESLDIPGHEPSLICPNQLRDNRLIVNDCPKQYDDDSSHSIDVVNLDVELLLQMHGVLSYLPTRYPSH